MSGVHFTKSWTEASCRKQYQWQRFKRQYPNLWRFVLVYNLVGSYFTVSFCGGCEPLTKHKHSMWATTSDVRCKFHKRFFFWVLHVPTTRPDSDQSHHEIHVMTTCYETTIIMTDELRRNGLWNADLILNKSSSDRMLRCTSLMSQLFGLVYRIRYFHNFFGWSYRSLSFCLDLLCHHSWVLKSWYFWLISGAPPTLIISRWPYCNWVITLTSSCLPTTPDFIQIVFMSRFCWNSGFRWRFSLQVNNRWPWM